MADISVTIPSFPGAVQAWGIPQYDTPGSTYQAIADGKNRETRVPLATPALACGFVGSFPNIWEVILRVCAKDGGMRPLKDAKTPLQDR